MSFYYLACLVRSQCSKYSTTHTGHLDEALSSDHLVRRFLKQWSVHFNGEKRRKEMVMKGLDNSMWGTQVGLYVTSSLG